MSESVEYPGVYIEEVGTVATPIAGIETSAAPSKLARVKHGKGKLGPVSRRWPKKYEAPDLSAAGTDVTIEPVEPPD